MSDKKRYRYDGKEFESKEEAQRYLDSKSDARPFDGLLLIFIASFILIFVISAFIAFNQPYAMVSFGSLAWASFKYSLLVCISVYFSNFLKGKLSAKKFGFQQTVDVDKKKFYEQVFTEIESKSMDRATLAQAIEQAKGDQTKVDSIYISLRIKDLMKRRSQ